MKSKNSKRFRTWKANVENLKYTLSDIFITITSESFTLSALLALLVIDAKATINCESDIH